MESLKERLKREYPSVPDEIINIMSDFHEGQVQAAFIGGELNLEPENDWNLAFLGKILEKKLHGQAMKSTVDVNTIILASLEETYGQHYSGKEYEEIKKLCQKCMIKRTE